MAVTHPSGGDSSILWTMRLMVDIVVALINRGCRYHELKGDDIYMHIIDEQAERQWKIAGTWIGEGIGDSHWETGEMRIQ